ncbi:hypothetical protein [Candidatus Tokpelaia sp.]|uniref:hypothetical protein n=1 Tax=Candidatus Tokpelaia sp. TaxID=2233777 RepID=UPI0016800A1B|nr:hypothetical protein [Candidatus Tokpelaia sp.]
MATIRILSKTKQQLYSNDYAPFPVEIRPFLFSWRANSSILPQVMTVTVPA